MARSHKYNSGPTCYKDTGEHNTSNWCKSREAGLQVGQEPGQEPRQGQFLPSLTSVLKRERPGDQAYLLKGLSFGTCPQEDSGQRLLLELPTMGERQIPPKGKRDSDRRREGCWVININKGPTQSETDVSTSQPAARYTNCSPPSGSVRRRCRQYSSTGLLSSLCAAEIPSTQHSACHTDTASIHFP